MVSTQFSKFREGVRAFLTTKKKYFFLKLYKKNPPKNVASKLEGGGGKALVAGPLKKNFFLASLRHNDFFKFISSF